MPAALPWFARHEMRLGLRDLSAMVRGGTRGRIAALVGVAIVAALMHAVAYAILRHGAAAALARDPRSLVVVSAIVSFSACLFLSQAIESVTRVLYGRGDLDLILSSPVSVRPILGVVSVPRGGGGYVITDSTSGYVVLGVAVVVLAVAVGTLPRPGRRVPPV